MTQVLQTLIITQNENGGIDVTAIHTKSTKVYSNVTNATRRRLNILLMTDNPSVNYQNSGITKSGKIWMAISKH